MISHSLSPSSNHATYLHKPTIEHIQNRVIAMMPNLRNLSQMREMTSTMRRDIICYILRECPIIDTLEEQIWDNT